MLPDPPFLSLLLGFLAFIFGAFPCFWGGGGILPFFYKDAEGSADSAILAFSGVPLLLTSRKARKGGSGHSLEGPGFLLSLAFAPASDIPNLQIRKSKEGASDIIPYRHNSGTNHRNGRHGKTLSLTDMR